MSSIGEKIKKLRGQQSYAEIARAVACSAPTIREIESDLRKDPSIRIISRIANYFNVPLDWMADDSVGWPPPASQEQKAVEIVRHALSAYGLMGELTERERACLAALRTLPHDRQAEVFGFVKGLAAEVGRHHAELSGAAAGLSDQAGKTPTDVSSSRAKRH